MSPRGFFGRRNDDAREHKKKRLTKMAGTSKVPIKAVQPWIRHLSLSHCAFFHTLSLWLASLLASIVVISIRYFILQSAFCRDSPV